MLEMDPTTLGLPTGTNQDELLRQLCLKLTGNAPEAMRTDDPAEEDEEEDTVEDVQDTVADQDTVVDQKEPKEETSMDDDHSNSEGSSGMAVEEEIAELKRNCTFLSHQLNMIMSALHVRPCTCETCTQRAETIRKEEIQAQEDILKSIFAQHRLPPPPAMHPHLSQQLQQKPAMGPPVERRPDTVATPTQQQAPPTQMPRPQINNNHHHQQIEMPKLMPVEAEKKENSDEMMMNNQLLQQLLNPEALAQFAELQKQMEQHMEGNAAGMPQFNNGLHGSPQRGRRSKYCTAEEKKAVAEYAQTHGAAAAARKFGIPPPVAAYYQRKEARTQQKIVQHQALIAAGVPASALTGLAPPSSGCMTPSLTTLPSSLPQTPATPHTPEFDGDHTEPSTPNLNINEMSFKMHSNNMQSGMSGNGNPAHTGSPGFLRGRGRGRPKLIGDELDAELVEYMVKVKNADPSQHLTASRALDISRQYIMNKAPGLLAEHGGQVRLKITWAMKLVSRVVERQKEIELGLPAGTLANMGRTLNQIPGQMASVDLMTQSIISQNITHLLEQLQPAGITPEIINGQEIDLSALLGMTMPHSNGAVNEGEIDDGERAESADSAESPQSVENMEDDQSMDLTKSIDCAQSIDSSIDLTKQPPATSAAQQQQQQQSFIFAS